VTDLPGGIQASLFDLDGVLTKTAAVHAAAWQEMFDSSVRFLQAVQQAGLCRAVVSSSANTAQVLKVAGLARFFEVRVDGITIAQRHLRGKPAPDTFLDAARQLDVESAHAAVFQVALAGVAAGRAGRFSYSVGVDRVGHARALAEHGADRVVPDLSELLGQRAGPR